jgi:hypothetical protein
MSQIHASIQNKPLQEAITKASGGPSKVKFWDNADDLVSKVTPQSNNSRIVIFDEADFLKHASVLNGKNPPLALVVINSEGDEGDPLNMATRALTHMERGANECLTPQMSVADIEGVFEFVGGYLEK